MDSHQPRQISQSDCEISNNCGKIVILRGKGGSEGGVEQYKMEPGRRWNETLNH